MKKKSLKQEEEEKRKKQMKINWFGAFPVIQSKLFKNKERKVEPAEKSNIVDNNDKKEDNYSGRSNDNDKE